MAENTSPEVKGKFSLVELLMIIMVVGIVFTFVVPMKTSQKRQDYVKEAIVNLQFLAKECVEFKNNPDQGDGDYPYGDTMDQLDNVTSDGPKWDVLSNKYSRTLDSKYFTYNTTDSMTVYARTTEAFGKEGLEIHYYLPNGPFIVSGEETRKEIDPNWLP